MNDANLPSVKWRRCPPMPQLRALGSGSLFVYGFIRLCFARRSPSEGGSLEVMRKNYNHRQTIN